MLALREGAALHPGLEREPDPCAEGPVPMIRRRVAPRPAGGTDAEVPGSSAGPTGGPGEGVGSTPTAVPRYWEVREGDLLRLLLDVPTGSVDAVATDCPYSSGGATRGDRNQDPRKKYFQSDSPNQLLTSFAGDARDARSFAYWCALWYAELLRCAADGAICFSFTDWRQLPATCDALQAGGWVWRGVVPWDKTEACRPQLGRPRAQCEFVVWGTKGPHKAWPGAPTIAGFQHDDGSDMFDVPSSIRCQAPRDRVHVTEKPLDVMRPLVSLVRPGGLILDPFCGYGTTGVAALEQGRRALLFEITSHFAAATRLRLAAVEARLRATGS